MIGSLEWRTFCVLLHEEWRLHTRLFGGWRFALFPLVITGLTVGGGIALVETGRSSADVLSGLHLFALAFGLYSGTAGFAGSDMLENVFGRLSLVLASSKTLPLSRRWLLGLFLVKDALFYGVAFVLPMALGTVPLFSVSTTTPVTVGIVWASLFSTFLAGMVCTVAAIALVTRGVPGWGIVLAATGTTAGLWWTGHLSPFWTGFVPLFGSLPSAVLLLGSTIVVGLLAVAGYDPAYARPTRTAGDRFTRIHDALTAARRNFVGDSQTSFVWDSHTRTGSTNTDFESNQTTGVESDATAGVESDVTAGVESNPTTGVVTKTLLDLARSSGGVMKPFVSVVILFALVAFLVGVVGSITGIEPAPGIFFGGVLGLSAFTTYNWLTQFDSVEEYLIYPVSVEEVFAAKRFAFVLVGGPTVLLPYVGAVLWYGATTLDAVVGAVLCCGYGAYYYGLTVYIAGFDPNEFLFDAVRFAAFTLGVAIALVPALVVGFVVVPPSTTVALVLVGASLAFGTIGYALSNRAGPRWARRYRAGT